jgi:hypothetical protein
MELKMNLIGSGTDARMQPRDIIPARPLDSKAQAIIDLILSDKGGRMTIDQVANFFRVDRSVVWNAIRIHAASKAPTNHFPVEAV